MARGRVPSSFSAWPLWKRAALGVCLMALPIELYLFALHLDNLPAAPPPLAPREISRNRVWTSINYDKPNVALANLEIHLKAFPDDAVIRLQAAALYEKEHQPAAALAHYQALEGRPAGPALSEAEGVARTVGATFGSRLPAVAGGLVRRSPKDEGGSPLPPPWLAEAPAERRRPTPAQRLEALTGAARCYTALDQHDLAALAWEEAARLAPKDAKVHRELGLVLHRQGDSLRALDALQESLALDPSQEDLHMLVSEIAMGKGVLDVPSANNRGTDRPFAPSTGVAFDGVGLALPVAAPRPIDPSRYMLEGVRPYPRANVSVYVPRIPQPPQAGF